MDFTFKNISEFGLVLKNKIDSILIPPGKTITFFNKSEMDKYMSDINVFLGGKLEQVKCVSTREVSLSTPMEVLVERKTTTEVSDEKPPQKKRGRRAKL